MASNGWDKFHKYIGVQGILAILLTLVLIFMLVQQLPIPDVLIGLTGTVYGFYFAKNGTNVISTIRGA